MQQSNACCFTGHRSIHTEDMSALTRALDQAIEQAMEQHHVTTFIAGGALGFDMLVAQRIIKLRQDDPTLRLILVLPFAGHDRRWAQHDREQLQQLKESADRIITLSAYYTIDCYQLRNEYMIKHSKACIAFRRHDRSGTSQTLRFAKQYNVPVILI